MKNININEIAETVFQTFRLIKTEMSCMNELTHLSILQVQTLFFLSHNKGTTMTDIAEYFHVELPSATSLLNKLCDQKLVERHTDKKDRRLVKVNLTNKGKVLLKKAMQERKKKLERILSYLSEKERFELLTLLKTLYSRLQK